MKNFNARFSAQVAKFNALSANTKLPECITALILLSNSAIDDSQCISVMAAAAHTDENLISQSTHDRFLSSITYQSIASVIKQCDKTSPETSASTAPAASSASTGHFRCHDRGGRNRNKRQSPSSKYPCDICGKYGQLKRNNNSDVFIPLYVKTYDNPLK